MNIFTYEIDSNLYINLTNKCTNSCLFCVRNSETYESYHLWLDNEPTVSQIIEQACDISKYEEIVFCGYGEPTFKIDEIIQLGKHFRALGKFVRLNTNGHGNKINDRDICGEIVDAVDVVSISLNQSDSAKYQKVCQSIFGEEAFDILINFAKSCVAHGIQTQLSVVEVDGVDIDLCKKIADEVGVFLKVRKYIPEQKN